MKVGDLFSGVGGMSQGFKMAGCFDIAFAVEYDKEIANAYKKNHTETDVYAEDIRNIDVKRLHEKHPTIDVIIGGPPCQGFSQKGKRMSIDDPRNFLFQQFVRFVKEFKPKYFVLENVPAIITTAKGFFKEQIIEAFRGLGYDVTCGVLCAADFGVPQDRKRAVFMGQLGKLQISLPTPLYGKVTIKDAIYDLPFIAAGEGEEESIYDKVATSEHQRLIRQNRQKLYNHVTTNNNATTLSR
jgi:DNA (cytosine-5)-methyltransferase 1